MVFSYFISLMFVFYLFFFFKQKTAYEMRISDWSSDVCSSDLLIDQNQAQLAFPQARQRGIDGQELAMNLLQLFGALRIDQTLTQQSQHFAILAAALTHVLIQNHFIECIAKYFRLAAYVDVESIAGFAVHHAASAGWPGVIYLDQSSDGR